MLMELFEDVGTYLLLQFLNKFLKRNIYLLKKLSPKFNLKKIKKNEFIFIPNVQKDMFVQTVSKGLSKQSRSTDVCHMLWKKNGFLHKLHCILMYKKTYCISSTQLIIEKIIMLKT